MLKACTFVLLVVPLVGQAAPVTLSGPRHVKQAAPR
jgi:hypothetical protein